MVIGTASTRPMAPTSVRATSEPISSLVATWVRLWLYADTSSRIVIAEPAYANTSV